MGRVEWNICWLFTAEAQQEDDKVKAEAKAEPPERKISKDESYSQVEVSQEDRSIGKARYGSKRDSNVGAITDQSRQETSKHDSWRTRNLSENDRWRKYASGCIHNKQ